MNRRANRHALHDRYYLSDLGIVNALGGNGTEVLANLLRGVAPGMHASAEWLQGGSVEVGAVETGLAEWPATLPQFRCRNSQLLWTAYLQIAPRVQALIERFGRARIGVVIGSSTSGIREGEIATAALAQTGAMPAGYTYRQQEIGAPALALAAALELDGPAFTVSTACSSSAKAFASARNLLELDLCDAVLVGGADSLCRLTVNGFAALESLSAGRCNPFSANRDGIVIGEGAALFVLTREPAPIALAGVGESADAHHISAPHPEGRGAEAAMRAALDDAGLLPAQIDYINLHGTATPKNDEMESFAVARVFGEHVPCSSTKPLTGHTLGAAGATEVGLCWLLLSVQNAAAQLPAQLWDGVRDPALAPIDLLGAPRAFGRDQPRRFLSNSFAFGGSNCAVIIEGGRDD
jgi:3-oxoacyl-[acyl-carrier-protein] synthase-1